MFDSNNNFKIKRDKNMVINCFPFLNELDLLEIRLKELDSVVDMFVLVEFDRTYTNKPKLYNFKNNKDKFGCNGKIRSYTVNMDSNDDCWMQELNQRNKIKEIVFNLCYQDDIIILSDADEIPHHQVVKEYADRQLREIYEVRVRNYKYYLNTWLKVDWDYLSYSMRIMRSNHLKGFNMDRRSFKRDTLPYLKGGWHFSYCGGAEKVFEKVNSFSHCKYLKPLSVEQIREKIINRKDLYVDDNLIIDPLDDSFPKYVLDNKEKFKSLILNGQN